MTRPCDSHALIATMDRRAYPLASDAAPPAQGELEAERDIQGLLTAMGESGVGKAVLVQRNRYYGYDNRYIHDALAYAPERLRAVCAIDGRMADCGEQARHWLGLPGVAGLRFMEPGRGAPLDWMAGDHVRAAWKAAADAGAIIQIHFFPWAREQGIEQLLPLMRDIPVRAVVIDNLSNIDLAVEPPGQGMDDAFRRLADFPNVMTRFTTMAIHRCTASGVDAAAALLEIGHVFGAKRMMWGTDILPTGVGYGEAVRLGTTALSRFNDEDRKAIAAGNAETLFFTGTVSS